MVGVGRVGFLMGLFFGFNRQIANRHDARFTIQFEVDIAGPVLVDPTHCIQFDNQGLARLDIYTDFITDIEAALIQ